jgi:hypothetical protein
MRCWWLRLALAMSLATGAFPRAFAEPSFEVLLAESHLQLEVPAGFTPVPVQANPVLSYEQALRDPEGRLEVRYALRPLGRLQIDYDDPHGAAPDPNHVFPLMFESIAMRLSGGGHTPTREYPVDQARRLFNADWAAAGVFDVRSPFATDFAQGLVLALHRNRVADAYLVLLFDDYAQAKPAIDRALASLRFRPG